MSYTCDFTTLTSENVCSKKGYWQSRCYRQVKFSRYYPPNQLPISWQFKECVNSVVKQFQKYTNSFKYNFKNKLTEFNKSQDVVSVHIYGVGELK